MWLGQRMQAELLIRLSWEEVVLQLHAAPSFRKSQNVGSVIRLLLGGPINSIFPSNDRAEGKKGAV